jgi:hypothetical protein
LSRDSLSEFIAGDPHTFENLNQTRMITGSRTRPSDLVRDASRLTSLSSALLCDASRLTSLVSALLCDASRLTSLSSALVCDATQT